MLAGLLAQVGDPAQVASTRLVELQDGQEKGVRAVHCKAGGGLDFGVLVERGLDLGWLDWRGEGIAWQGPNGFRRPDLINADGEGGRGFGRGFGGLLVTCGLERIRQPEGGGPLHGRLPYTPARLIRHGVDWEADPPTLVVEGEVVQAGLEAEHLRLHRRIEAPVGTGLLRLEDRVTNRAPAPIRPALLYHLNLGHPFLRPGVRVRLGDETLLTTKGPSRDAHPVVTCHRVAGGTTCEVGVTTPEGPALTMRFATATLSYLQLWHDPRPGMYVLAVEPCTSARRADGGSVDDDSQPALDLGEHRSYGFTLALA